jgi:hypothetical protein
VFELPLLGVYRSEACSRGLGTKDIQGVKLLDRDTGIQPGAGGVGEVPALTFRGMDALAPVSMDLGVARLPGFPEGNVPGMGEW